MHTVDDLIQTLESYKKLYSEFGKYVICIDALKDNDVIPQLKESKLYINSDIGQVEIFYDNE